MERETRKRKRIEIKKEWEEKLRVNKRKEYRDDEKKRLKERDWDKVKNRRKTRQKDRNSMSFFFLVFHGLSTLWSLFTPRKSFLIWNIFWREVNNG